MTNQQNKALVWAYWQAMNDGGGQAAFAAAVHEDVVWHGFRPLRHLAGSEAIWRQFWQPLQTAIPDLVRRPYHFIGGHFEGNDWVCGTGDFVGTFAFDWLGIGAHGGGVHFRFGEFCRVTAGRISEFRLIMDLPELMRQVGINLLPPDYGRSIRIPGPLARDGICLDAQGAAEGKKSLALVERMIFGGLNEYDGKDQDSQGLEQFWQPDMMWYGPAGIGAAFGLDEFKRNAQGPIVHAFPDRRGVGHQARIAEGAFAASTGWPSLVGTHRRAYMGWAPTDGKTGWNIMDFWKRAGDRLIENWVMIDLIDAALAAGVDLLAKLPRQP